MDVEVSIHALVRVRPQKEGTKVKREKVSIHALVRVRRGSATVEDLMEGFNPRTRESATLTDTIISDGEVFQSTHS